MTINLKSVEKKMQNLGTTSGKLLPGAHGKERLASSPKITLSINAGWEFMLHFSPFCLKSSWFGITQIVKRHHLTRDRISQGLKGEGQPLEWVSWSSWRWTWLTWRLYPVFFSSFDSSRIATFLFLATPRYHSIGISIPERERRSPLSHG